MKFFSVLIMAAFVLASGVASAAPKQKQMKRWKPVSVAGAKQYTPSPRKVVRRRAASSAPMPVITPCGELQTPPNMRVTENTPGYRQVEVAVDLAHSLENVQKQFPLQITFVFGLESLSPEIRKDDLGAIKWVSPCHRDVRSGGRFFKAGTTWIKVKGVSQESDIWEDRKGLTVRADVWLPESVIEAEVPVSTILKDNDLYLGSWTTDEAGNVKLTLRSTP